MARRKSLTDIAVAKLKPRAKRYAEPDPELRGHYVRVTPNGAKSFVAVARDPYGKQVWATIGGTDVFKIDDAREAARTAIKRVKAGQDAFEAAPEKPDSFKAVAENYIERHVKAKGLRSRPEIERILNKFVYPTWKDRDFGGIGRADVAKMLDHVEDTSGPRQADCALAVVRGIMNWYASRSDDYVTPVARGMRRTDPRNMKRARVLDDDELRAVWNVAENNGAFGAIVRLAVLTAQRREKIAAMRWEDVTVDGVWNVPAEEREKGNGGALVLPGAALSIIREQNRVGDNAFVFAGRGDNHVNGFSASKRAFDEKVTAARRKAASEAGADPATVEPLASWRIHDLRRTARSLMSRAGVRPDIAERVMGHAIEGVEGVYDRYEYRAEKADALKRLAGLVERIVAGADAGNVFKLRAAE